MSQPLPKPEQWDARYGTAFQDQGVAEAYVHRPPYPEQLFELMRGLIVDEPRNVLELGCGTGEIARRLAPEVERVDAVEPSAAMLDIGRSLAGGDHSNLHWRHSSAEAFDYRGPYALIVAAESIHWLDWPVVFSRMAATISAKGRLFIVHNRRVVADWNAARIGALIGRLSANRDYERMDLFDELTKRGYLELEERLETAPVERQQPLESYLEYYHSMSGLSRERLGPEKSAEFDDEVRQVLAPQVQDGVLRFRLTVTVGWGRPLAP